MNVTDEMVEAGAISDAAFDGRDFAALGRADKARYRERSRKALEAALAAMPQEPVAVKPLEWDGVMAITSFGSYTVCDMTWIGDGATWTYHEYPYGDESDKFATVDEAKAAAQADFERRVRSCLTTPAQGAQPSEEDDLRAAVEAGWNACRKSIYAVCEDVQNEADRLQKSTGPYGDTEDAHAKDYFAGQRYAAKSIARGFNSMEARDDDHAESAFVALRNERRRAGEGK